MVKFVMVKVKTKLTPWASSPFHSLRKMGMHPCKVEKISKHIVPRCAQSICLIAENLQQSYHTCSPLLLCSNQHQSHQLTSTITAAKTKIKNKLAGFKCYATINRNKTNKMSGRAFLLQPRRNRGAAPDSLLKQNELWNHHAQHGWLQYDWWSNNVSDMCLMSRLHSKGTSRKTRDKLVKI